MNKKITPKATAKAAAKAETAARAKAASKTETSAKAKAASKPEAVSKTAASPAAKPAAKAVSKQGKAGSKAVSKAASKAASTVAPKAATAPKSASKKGGGDDACRFAYMDVIIAGFGGQGVLLIGNLLAQAGMDEGLNVTYIPVYGAEMRGGTANCTVVVSSEEIGSPIIRAPKSLIILNQPSLEKFQPRLADNGVQVVNADLVDMSLTDKKRVRTVPVSANKISESLGNSRMANMVALGAYLKATGIIPLKAAQNALEHVISKHYANLIPKNAEALELGYKAAG